MKLNVLNRLVLKKIKEKDEIIFNFIKGELQSYAAENNIDITDKESVKELLNKLMYEYDEYGVIFTYGDAIEYRFNSFLTGIIESCASKIKYLDNQGYYDWLYLTLDEQRKIFMERLLK